MFKLISKLTARPARRVPLVLSAAVPVLGDRAFDHHVWAWQDHFETRYLAEHWAEEEAAQLTQAFEDRRDAQKAQAIWDTMEDEERDEVLFQLDRLNTGGRLADHMFFDQWLAIRRRGVVRD